MPEAFMQKHAGEQNPGMREQVSPVGRHTEKMQELLKDRIGLIGRTAVIQENTEIDKVDNYEYRYIEDNNTGHHITIAKLPLNVIPY